MFKKDGYFFVCRHNSDNTSPYTCIFDVFKDNVLIDSYPFHLKGMPWVMDHEERLICFDREDQQVTIYSFSFKGC